MDKPTKEEANYRLPNDCCAYCVGSYFNTMDDAMCSTMQPGNRIDAGGVCDYFTRATDE